MKALIIKKKYLDLIFSGEKTWELRGSNSKIRGTIGLIESGSGLIIGAADLIEVIGPLSLDDLNRNINKTQYDPNQTFLKYKNTYAWSLSNIIKFENPIKYKHPQGAIIWVNVDPV